MAEREDMREILEAVREIRLATRLTHEAVSIAYADLWAHHQALTHALALHGGPGSEILAQEAELWLDSRPNPDPVKQGHDRLRKLIRESQDPPSS